MNVRHAAAEILERVQRGGGYSHILVSTAAEHLDRAEDRALLRELVGGTLRWRGRLDFLLNRYSNRPLDDLDPRLLDLLRLGIYQLAFLDRVPDHAAVNETVGAVRRRCGTGPSQYANAVLRAAAGDRGRYPLPRRRSDRPALYIASRYSLPGWLAERWTRRLGPDEAEQLAEASAQAPPVTFRICRSPFRDPPDEARLLADLRAEGLQWEEDPVFPGVFRVTSGFLAARRAFRQGRLVIQDGASQAVPLLTGLSPGQTAVDACSAPGGKAIRLAEMAGRAGKVIAADLHPARLGRVMENCRRLGIENILPLAGDLAGSAPLRGSFDVVLVDAPCSGTGTLRRHPEIRWRTVEAELERLADLQGRLLAGAASLVRPGGSLVYAVCSLEPEEGEQVVAQFLERPGFELDDPSPLLPEPLGDMVGADRYFRTWPHRQGCDGFFAARLVRGK